MPAAATIAQKCSAMMRYETISPTPNGTKKRAMELSRNRAAGRTASARTHLSESSTKRSSMPMTFPET